MVGITKEQVHGIDAKKAQHRLNVLLNKHFSLNTESAKALGVDEVYNERTELFDELLALYDDMKEEQKEIAGKVANEAQRNENKGSNSISVGKLLKMMNAMQEDNKAELGFRMSQLEFQIIERWLQALGVSRARLEAARKSADESKGLRLDLA
ncbi:hypothetical protein H257_14913 [Aphanomyces astaci]|uniref:Uncharacterized protein n=1 Tax=Aphanomyces astaci TaxID=112090 RepID=W4FQQ9_APHAT|nr:hypothetical protein H257_14913 [Aphanomyces astaci]ETV69286.1 hypothetical protein H257_14913 [Aphanomyces astaci]|eukprot:XP_009841143.1 hypothetical protein H257_14913 [Aphanomyces astaci]